MTERQTSTRLPVAQQRLDLKAKGTPGRPSGLLKADLDLFLNALRAGNYRTAAARAAGLKPNTVEHWIRRGEGKLAPERPPKPEYVAFCQMVYQAEASAEVMVVGSVVASARQHPDVAMRFLAHRFPDRWASLPGDIPDLPQLPGSAQPSEPSVTFEDNRRQIIVLRPEDLPELARRQLVAQLPGALDGDRRADRIATLRVAADDDIPT